MIVSKSEFAKYCRVDKSRVSQWLKAKQIGPHCLVGEGRNARINAEFALADLRKKLAVDQRCGLNGLSTKLDDPVADDEIMIDADLAEKQLREHFNPPGTPRRTYSSIVRDGLTGGPEEIRVAAETLRLLNETVVELDTEHDCALDADHILALIDTIYRGLRGGADDVLMFGLGATSERLRGQL
jgi:hypothetical protein